MLELPPSSTDLIPPVDLRLSHLLVQLAPIDLQVRQHLNQYLAEQEKNGTPLNQGIRTLADNLGAPHWVAHVADWQSLQAWPQALEDSRLAQLVQRFQLSRFERDLLLLCLLPVLDARYRMVHAALTGDSQKNGQLTRELALTLLCMDLIDQIECHAYLAPDATLFCEGLLYWKQHDRAGMGISGTLHLNSAVYLYLLGHDRLNPDLASCGARLAVPVTEDPFPDFTRQLTLRLRTTSSLLMLLQGVPGSGRSDTVARAAGALGREALSLNLELLPKDDEQALEVLEGALQDVKLRGGCLVLRGIDHLARSRRELHTQFIARLRGAAPSIICLTDLHAAPSWLGDRPHLVWQHPQAETEAQAASLRHSLPQWATLSDSDLVTLVKRYHLFHASLPILLAEADYYRQDRDPTSPLLEADLRKACRLRSQQHFGELARRTEPRRSLSDLIVSDELAGQLQEVVGAIRQRERVLAQGFERKVGYGTGISALFYGDSGTGKTMAAEVIAHTLEVDLITIDLSAVVNASIGQTEKNLARVFDLAERDSGVLLFDEADALFGKRSETKEIHDRHANIQISYLLQRLEKYPGLVIISSNHRTHLDDAFNRRITFMLRFAAPDVLLRERMWREIWPQGVRLSKEVDFAELARRTDISGANIRNIALAATWLAADGNSAEISGKHIEHAMQRELSKMGRLLI